MHRTLLVATLLAAGPALAADAAPPASSAEEAASAARLAELAPMLGLKVGKKDRKALQAAAADPRPEVRALAVALLYAQDPVDHQDALASLFAVEERPEARVVGHHEVDDRLAVLADACGGAIPPEIEPLLVFLAYKDTDACFETPSGTTSVAKFYRSAFLALAWAEAESAGRVDRKRVLQSIDQRAASPDAQAGGGL